VCISYPRHLKGLLNVWLQVYSIRSGDRVLRAYVCLFVCQNLLHSHERNVRASAQNVRGLILVRRPLDVTGVRTTLGFHMEVVYSCPRPLDDTIASLCRSALSVDKDALQQWRMSGVLDATTLSALKRTLDDELGPTPTILLNFCGSIP